MLNNNFEKPCLVPAQQGFSVRYNERFLYSKYNPEKSVLAGIEKLSILPGSIILAFSPVLGYGVKELSKKAGPDSLIILIEKNLSLYEFSLSADSQLKHVISALDNIVYLSEKEIFNLPVILQKNKFTFDSGKTVSFNGQYRRVISIDLSAGAGFNSDFYRTLFNASVQSIKQFWTNRITLTKFGRKYSHNIFKNLSYLKFSKPLETLIHSVTKKIIVFGAGESSEIGIKKIINYRKDYFILCADTAFPMLRNYGITPDGIVIDEAQSVISESFIGCRTSESIIFQSLCALPHPAGINFPKERIVFYATDYVDSDFLENLKKEEFFPPVIPPFGSVGITAFFIANLLKKDAQCSVEFYGLDFMYSLGKTHAKGTPAFQRQHRNLNRLSTLENFGPSLGSSSVALGNNWFTTPLLSGYRNTFELVRSRELWNTFTITDRPNKNLNADIFLKNERKTLLSLKMILSGEEKLPKDEAIDEIKKLVENREYLYLHFPDGFRFSSDISFLKRIRSEIDSYLKILPEN